MGPRQRSQMLMQELLVQILFARTRIGLPAMPAIPTLDAAIQFQVKPCRLCAAQPGSTNNPDSKARRIEPGQEGPQARQKRTHQARGKEEQTQQLEKHKTLSPQVFKSKHKRPFGTKSVKLHQLHESNHLHEQNRD